MTFCFTKLTSVIVVFSLTSGDGDLEVLQEFSGLCYCSSYFSDFLGDFLLNDFCLLLIQETV